MRDEILDARQTVQTAMDMTGLDATNLAKAAKVSPSTLTRLMGDNPKNVPNHKTMLQILNVARQIAGVSGKNMETASKTEVEHNLISIPEYDVSASAGGGTIIETERLNRNWTIPRNFLSFQVSNPENLAIIGVAGESMEPEYFAGDRVLVDVGCHKFTHDGIYVLDTGFGLIIKQLQLSMEMEAASLRVISKNPTYPSEVVPMQRVNIKGRVVGKWMWK